MYFVLVAGKRSSSPTSHYDDTRATLGGIKLLSADSYGR